MTKKSEDPHAQREASKYENPIPSREYIIHVLAELGCPTGFKKLAQTLDLHSDEESQALDYRLRAMLRDGQLLTDRRGRYCLVDELSLVRGRVSGHSDGYGFVIPEQAGEDIYLSPKEMRSVFHGDRVLVRPLQQRNRRGRFEGIVLEVLERNTTRLVGRYVQDQGYSYVEPENRKISKDIYIPIEHNMHAHHGQIVMVEIVAQPTRKANPLGKIVEILGDHMAPGMEIDVAIRSYGLPYQWSLEVIEEANALPDSIQGDEFSNRLDLRSLSLVTIDGEDARDFDDAVHCKPNGKNGWILTVAIADVSHYVQYDSALDNVAKERGNSVYFPEQVIPMLPEKLSNHLCSLNPLVDRLCMVCVIDINAKGKVNSYQFHEAVMHSQARMTYTDVAAILEHQDAQLSERYASLIEHLQNLYDLFKVLHQQRAARGAIEFETTETRIVFSANRKIESVIPAPRNVAHRVIEECMLLANVCAADFLLEKKIPALYRIHATPSDSKIQELREFLDELGLKLAGGKKPKPKDYAKLLDSIRGRPDHHIIQMVMLRSLSQAVYSPENIGHFGLAYDRYTHFTSPIRRFPDLLVHRAIRHLLQNKSPESFYYDVPTMTQLGLHCSQTERRADEATRDAVDWLKCEYMLERVGQVFDGVVSSVVDFGLFVELSEVYVEGLVHVTSLHNEYYQYDPIHHRLRGTRTGKTYRLGDKISVLVARVDLDDRKIDFELA